MATEIEVEQYLSTRVNDPRIGVIRALADALVRESADTLSEEFQIAAGILDMISKRTSEAQPAEEPKPGEWLRDGNLIYMLEETGQYRKGVETLRNRFTVQVVSEMHQPKAEADALVERVHTLLQDDQKQSGADLMVKANAARDAFKEWVESTYPIGAEVEFKPYASLRNQSRGRVNAANLDRDGLPVVTVYSNITSYRINPIENPITVLTPTEVTE